MEQQRRARDDAEVVLGEERGEEKRDGHDGVTPAAAFHPRRVGGGSPHGRRRPGQVALLFQDPSQDFMGHPEGGIYLERLVELHERFVMPAGLA